MPGSKKKASRGNNMRHRISGKQLGRNHHERQALLKSQVRSILLHGSIKTTDAKVKAVRPLIEHLVSDALTKPALVAIRQFFIYFQDQTLSSAAVTKLKEAFGDLRSNFTSTKNIKFRQGDNALIVKLSLVKPFTLIAPKEVVKTKPKKVVKSTKVTKK